MRRLFGFVLVAVVCATSAADAGFSTVLSAPQSVGDQVVFYYDTRANFTTFLTIRNMSQDQLTVNVLFYGPTLSTPFSKSVTLAGSALTIIDAGALRGNGLPAQPGIAFATAVDGSGQAITSGALTGNFTIANLQTGAAFGAAGAARSTLTDGEHIPNVGSPIDGTHAIFTLIRPSSALLAAYYDPTSLAPVASSGNQLIFLTFEDRYDSNWTAAIGSTTWNVTTTRSSGAEVDASTFTARIVAAKGFSVEFHRREPLPVADIGERLKQRQQGKRAKADDGKACVGLQGRETAACQG